MSSAAIIWIIINVIAFIFIDAKEHGELKETPKLVHVIFGFLIHYGLFFWGGFFTKMDWPQWFLIATLFIMLCRGAYLDKHPDIKVINFFINTIFFIAIFVMPLYFGGFFN